MRTEWGSASELEYHLLLAKDLNLIKPAGYEELAPRATELTHPHRAHAKAES